MRTCRLLTFGEAADLFVRTDWEWFQRIVQLERGRLPTLENGFNDDGRQQTAVEHVSMSADAIDFSAYATNAYRTALTRSSARRAHSLAHRPAP
jgi:hypothetical protein